jgi:sigma-B regulation protein RsbU (phosphoserine phosphatase)
MLMRTNALMVADSSSDYFVTAYYGVLDPVQHRLTYASAGHNLAYFAATNGGAAQAMTTKGLPLGILPEIEIEQQSFAMAPGDVVLFYTDGVSDAMNAADEEFGSTRLAEALAAHRAESAEAIADAIVAAVQAFTGDVAQYDDFTMIVLKRKESPHDGIQTARTQDATPGSQ